MELFILSSLEKVFYDEKPSAPEYKCFSMLKNEKSSFQAVFMSENDTVVSAEITGCLADKTKIFTVKSVPVGNATYDDADDFYLRKNSGNYPDVLEPLNGEIKAEKGKWYSIWIEVSPDGEFGGSELTVKLSANGETAEKKIGVSVIDAELPKQELIYTNWFHCDCLCNYYNVEPFTDEFWRICKNYVKTAVDHGMNCILTPVFTPPLDTKVGGERKTVQLVKVRRRGGKYSFNFTDFRKWVAMCRECGIEYFEISHLFTQWGAKHAPKIVAKDRKGREKKIFGWATRTSSKEYDDFLRQFAKAFIKVLESENISNNCLFHVSDEPAIHQLKTYKKRAKLISEIFPGYRVVDALSDYAFYETGAVKQPIPAENDIEDFVGNVPELWTYYCCGQYQKNLPNRFMSMPSQRNRAIGFLLYKYNVKGFLQWGYNFYNLQYSVAPLDPYMITDAGGGFPSGDSFMVYPANDGTTVESLRIKVLYDAFQDIRALCLLESKIGREKTLELIENNLATPLSFIEYPHEAEWILETRNNINRMIKEN